MLKICVAASVFNSQGSHQNDGILHPLQPFSPQWAGEAVEVYKVSDCGIILLSSQQTANSSSFLLLKFGDQGCLYRWHRVCADRPDQQV